jgi:hypothetical protein
MSVDIGVMGTCTCGHRIHGAAEYRARGRLTFVACSACDVFEGTIAATEDDVEAPCACGGTLREWDHQTCPRCRAPIHYEWFHAYN